MPSTRATLLLAVLLVASVAGPVAASPRPTYVCPACGEGFVRAAEYGSADLDVTVERSTAVVRVRPDGTAEWTVRNRLAGPDADRLRTNATLLRDVADDAFRSRRATLAGVESTADGVTLRYRSRDAATRGPLGVLRVTLLREEPGAYIFTGLGADRLTVVGPEGTAASWAPSGATVDGRRVTVAEYDGRGDGPFLTYAPSGAALPWVRSLVAVGAAVAEVVAVNLLLFVLLPLGVLLGGFLALRRLVVPRADRSPDAPRRYGAALAGLGAVAAVHPVYAEPAPLLGGYDPLLLAGGMATLVAGGAGLVADRVPPDRRLPVAVLTTLVGTALGVAVAAVAPALGVPDASPLRYARPGTVVLWAGPLLPFLLAFPAGYLAAGDRRGWYAALAALALSFVLVAGRFGPLTSTGGPFAVLGAVLLVAGAVALVVCGAPLFALGVSLRGTREGA